MKLLRRFTLFDVVLFVAMFLILTVAFGPRGLLVSEHKARTALETQGFTDVTITDRAWLFIPLRGGDKSDCVRFTAKATNSNKKTVQVYVFSGWPFKGATIRTP